MMPQKFMTKAIEKRFERLGCQERAGDCRDELETITGRYGLHMERDKWWREVPLSAVLSGAVS
jgi:hypothetical protein